MQKEIFLDLKLRIKDAEKYTMQGDFERAISIYQDLIKMQPDNAFLYDKLGQNQAQLQEWLEANNNYQKALKLGINNPFWTYKNLGDALKELNRFDEAILNYQQAISLQSDNPNVYDSLGQVQFLKGYLQEAIASYQKALELKIDHPFWTYKNLGDALIKTENRLEDAISAYQKALELQPDNAWISVNLEELKARKNNLKSDNTSRIVVITPVYNGEKYIDETIYSIITQSGNFSIRYHVQDGQSTDGTVEKLKEWQQRINNPDFVTLCHGIEFSFSSNSDRGMYDAINQGAQAVGIQSSDYMTWLNSDDCFAPGAFSTVANIFSSFAEVHWLGGRSVLSDQHGSMTTIYELKPYDTKALKSGLYDGRKLPFVMQEGTFWHGYLWQKVEGLNNSLKLAGDYDLWRKFARHADLVLLNSVLATHRRHDAQLSGSLEKYHQEIDSLLGDEGLEEYDKNWRGLNDPLNSNFNSQLSGLVLEYDIINSKSWHLKPVLIQSNPNESLVLSNSGQKKTINCIFGEGFGLAEGPYPSKNLPAGIHWTNEKTNYLKFKVEESGNYNIYIVCQTFSALNIKITNQNELFFDRELPVTQHATNCKIEAKAFLQKGINTLKLEAIPKSPGDFDRLLIINCEAVISENTTKLDLSTQQHQPKLEWPYYSVNRQDYPETLPDGTPWPKISLITPTYNQGKFIEETILSVINQQYPNLEYILIDGASTDNTIEVINKYQEHLSFFVSEPDKGQSEAINKGFRQANGEIVSWLNSDDRLAPGALFAVALAFYSSQADIVAGICQVMQNGVETFQHAPSCNSGVLVLDEILDLDNSWLTGKFFYQPEVMFTRALWEKVGGYVDESLYFSMDYEMWARFAAAGASIQVINTPIAQYRMHEEQKTSTPERYKPELIATRDELCKRFQRSLDFKKPRVPSRKINLKIVFFNDVGFRGGAGIAHQRIAQAFAQAGHQVISIAGRSNWYAEPLNCLPQEIYQLIADVEPDLVIVGNLHDLHQGADILEMLVDKFPTIYVMHDQWLLTGRCAYTGNCDKYTTICDVQCPTSEEYPSLDSAKIADAFNQKHAILNSDNLLVVGDSKWMTDWAREAYQKYLSQATDAELDSKFHHIHYGLDLDIFQPRDLSESRRILGFPQDKFIILTGSQSINDERKGFKHLLRALEIAELDNVLLLSFGVGSQTADKIEINCTGYIDDPLLLSYYYSAADLFVGASLEEAFGQTFIEAAACGTPAIGYKTGGVPEAVTHQVSGLIVEEKEPALLAQAIAKLYNQQQQKTLLSKTAPVNIANTFSLQSCYYSFMVALAETNWLDKLQMSPASIFTPTRQPIPNPVYYHCDQQNSGHSDIFSGEGIKGYALKGFRNLEPPYPEYSIFHSSRWALYPESRIAIVANRSMSGQLIIRYRNFCDQQSLELWDMATEECILSKSLAKAKDFQSISINLELKEDLNFFCFKMKNYISDSSEELLGLHLGNIAFEEFAEQKTQSKQDGSAFEYSILMDNNLHGTGWFTAEQYQGEFVRWMKETGTIFVQKPVTTEKDLEIKIGIGALANKEFINDIAFRVNGHKIMGSITYDSNCQSWLFKGTIPAKNIVPQSSVIISIQTSGVQTLSSTDTREASILVKSVNLKS